MRDRAGDAFSAKSRREFGTGADDCVSSGAAAAGTEASAPASSESGSAANVG
jgi:hypothetical protein